MAAGLFPESPAAVNLERPRGGVVAAVMDGGVDGWREVKARIAAAEKAAGRPAGSVTLVAVSKTFEADAIMPVIEAGQRVFGENRVQEAMRKWPPLRERYPDIELHLI